MRTKSHTSGEKLYRQGLAVGLLLLSMISFPNYANAQCSAQTDIPTAQCSTLENIYHSTGGENWTDNSNWLNNTPCSWFGVTCENGEVTRLFLANNGLTGTVSSLSSLEKLAFLNFDGNSISGTLPNLNGLANLRLADFFGNNFSGKIAPFENLPELNYLNIGSNPLTGDFPTSLPSLPQLQTLILTGTQFTGSLPLALLKSSLSGLALDKSSFCSPSLELTKWLADFAEPITGVDFCWQLSAEVGSSILSSGETLRLFSRIKSPKLTTTIVLDLYISLLLPNSDSEVFFVLKNGQITTEVGSSNSADWIPTVSDFPLQPNFDSTLLPIFAYAMNGSEPEGVYRMRIRATNPGSKEITNFTETSFYFSPQHQQLAIAAQAYADYGNQVDFQLSNTSTIDGVTYHWDFDDGQTAAGTQVSHTFNTVDRYRVQVTPILNEQALAESTIHYINVGRPLSQTVYPQRGENFSAAETVNLDFPWNDCDPNWQVYYSKYFKMFIESNLDSNIERDMITNGLLFSDYLFEQYSNIFGWDYIPTSAGLDIYICSSIPGAGTGTGGTFSNSEQFTKPAAESISAPDYDFFVHEFIHAWDFRGGLWLNSEDSPHAFTGGMEPIVAALLGTGQGISSWGGDLSVLPEFSPEYLLNHYSRVGLGRYLKKPQLQWSSYYTEAFQNQSYDDENIPENKEALLVQGGLLISLYNMHGLDGLKRIFTQIERLSIKDKLTSESKNYTEADRSENFMRAVADGLELDVSDYFRYWKWPVDTLDAYMTRYPRPSQLNDTDADGYSPLQGDRDDEDSSVFPYASELIDGKDNNQDGLIDENVYEEKSNDVSTMEIALPALILGSIATLVDEDTYEFTLSESTVISIVMYSADGSATLPYSNTSNRSTSIFTGTVYLDNNVYSEFVHEAWSAPEALSAIRLEAGTHRLKISAQNRDDRNGNTGDYEVQVFTSQYEHSLSAESTLNFLYNSQ